MRVRECRELLSVKDLDAFLTGVNGGKLLTLKAG